jgi:hypothetical protein
VGQGSGAGWNSGLGWGSEDSELGQDSGDFGLGWNLLVLNDVHQFLYLQWRECHLWNA